MERPQNNLETAGIATKRRVLKNKRFAGDSLDAIDVISIC